jgi:hypothetical protein
VGFYSASYKQNSLSISWESDLLVAIVVLSYSVAVRQAMMIGCVFASEAMAMELLAVGVVYVRTIDEQFHHLTCHNVSGWFVV